MRMRTSLVERSPRGRSKLITLSGADSGRVVGNPSLKGLREGLPVIRPELGAMTT